MKIDVVTVAGYLLGLIITVFFGVELIFYVQWLGIYFDTAASLGDLQSIVGSNSGQSWPPQEETALKPRAIPFLSTVVLFGSAISVLWSWQSMRTNNRNRVIWGLLASILLGAVFIILQALDSSQAAFDISQENSNTALTLVSGRHGFSSIIGLVLLCVLFFISLKADWIPKMRFGFEVAIWYWQFTVVIWLVLFTCIYVLRLVWLS